MERNEIIKALECCTDKKKYHCEDCPYFYKSEGIKSSMEILMTDALSLIKELTVELEAMRGAANSFKMHNERLTEENERLNQSCTNLERKCASLNEDNERLTINMNAYGLTAKNLGEENERLRGILLQFTDIVHKWGNKNGYDTSEISLVPILNEESEIKKQIKADTVRKMQERVTTFFTNDDMLKYNEVDADYINEQVDQIAEEMLEGEK